MGPVKLSLYFYLHSAILLMVLLCWLRYGSGGNKLADMPWVRHVMK